ncbi:MAG TPA: RNA methyltransferase [Pyrinomonadaceae bacterium]|jgi:TrmH family RNA methyltransferase|nr:RNA methyltransferase [Pyrinomonadaceae bacterium]
MITSRKNPLVQKARSAREGRERELIFVEGLRLCEEAAAARLAFEFVLYDPLLEDDERAARLLGTLRAVCPQVMPAGRDVIESASDTKTSQGVVAVARRPHNLPEKSPTGTPLVVVMHRVNNPSNAGAMLRVAEAAGSTAVVATRGSTDLFSPKSLRGSMGSAFRLPVWAGPTLEEVLNWCADREIRTVAAASSARATHTELDWTAPRALVLGPEAGGLSDEEVGRADDSVRIPMRPPVESLNVATALAVILYEAARQRNFK